tara:strand:+ start:4703 stop:5317 length:615 start_codon:yes stop_codon:yes gene_type:complete
MAFTRVLGPGIHTASNINSHNIKSTGIITATKFDGPFDSLTVSGNLSIGGTITYEDVTNVDSIGIVTARSGIQGIGIQSGGVNVAVGVITALNFIGAGNTFAVSGTTVDISIAGGGGGGSGAGFSTSNAGLHTTSSIGLNTTSISDAITGVGNSFQGIYVSNGMMIMDNVLNGNHYIGTAFNGLMAGPVNIDGTLTIDGNYVVV